jgi:hypothetical protein
MIAKGGIYGLWAPSPLPDLPIDLPISETCHEFGELLIANLAIQGLIGFLRFPTLCVDKDQIQYSNIGPNLWCVLEKWARMRERRKKLALGNWP